MISWVLVEHTCNPSYLGSKDQDDCDSKPAQANMNVKPYLKNIQHKKGLAEWLK
jgi:hypothetical protein